MGSTQAHRKNFPIPREVAGPGKGRTDRVGIMREGCFFGHPPADEHSWRGVPALPREGRVRLGTHFDAKHRAPGILCPIKARSALN